MNSARTETVDSLVEAIIASNPGQKNFLRKSLETIEDRDAELCELYLDYCRSHGVSPEELAAAYNLFVRETMKEQMFFARHGRYRYSSYSEVAGAVYLDPDYMRKYMHGLAVSTFLWPNHRAMDRFFESTLPRETGGRYLEVGPGHGFHMLRAMARTSFDRYEGLDISPASVELTRSILTALASPAKRFEVRLADFLSLPETEQADALIMGEVLEHVEGPQRFLEKVRQVSHAATHIYLSTCINAPEIDHIALFSSMEQLRQMIDQAGLRVREEIALPHNGVSLEEARENRLAINVAFVLARG